MQLLLKYCKSALEKDGMGAIRLSFLDLLNVGILIARLVTSVLEVGRRGVNWTMEYRSTGVPSETLNVRPVA